MQVKDRINQWRDARKPKRGGSGQIFELLYFQNRKEFATDFFCVFILPIDEQTVWIWAKSEGVTWQLFWKVVVLAWNDPNSDIGMWGNTLQLQKLQKCHIKIKILRMPTARPGRKNIYFPASWAKLQCGMVSLMHFFIFPSKSQNFLARSFLFCLCFQGLPTANTVNLWNACKLPVEVKNAKSVNEFKSGVDATFSNGQVIQWCRSVP